MRIIIGLNVNIFFPICFKYELFRLENTNEALEQKTN